MAFAHRPTRGQGDRECGYAGRSRDVHGPVLQDRLREPAGLGCVGHLEARP